VVITDSSVVEAVVGAALMKRFGVPLALSTFVMVALLDCSPPAVGGIVGTTDPKEEVGIWCTIVFSRGLEGGIIVGGG